MGRIATIPELFKELGSTIDVGSGLFVFSYSICDQSHLFVNSSDMKNIMGMRKSTGDKTEDLSVWQQANCKLDSTQKAVQQ